MDNKEIHSDMDFDAEKKKIEEVSTQPISIEEFFDGPPENIETFLDGNEKTEKDVTYDDISEDEMNTFNAIQESIKSEEEVKKEKAREANRRAYAKRKKMNSKSENTSKKTSLRKKTTKKSATSGPKKPSYIKDKMLAVTLVMKQHLVSRYKEGCNSSPCQLMGHNAYAKECKKNAFERLQIEQSKFAQWGVIPEWFIISRDDVSILDPYFVDTLGKLKDTTHAIGPMGVSVVKRSGKFFSPGDINDVKGSIVQGNMDNSEWNYIVSPGNNGIGSHQVSVVTAGLVAVRGETFMDIDFTEMAESSTGGFYHFIADICMEVNKRNKVVGVLKTLIRQEDSTSSHANTEEFKLDHLAFVRKWQHYLPIRF